MYFDIGANIGNWSKQNLLNKSYKIIAVEASPRTYTSLVENVVDIGVKCINYAVCDNSNKPITFFDAAVHTISTLNEDWLRSEKSRFFNFTPYNAITVETITLDKMIETFGQPDLIKIDVEGGEYECIKSLSIRVPLLCFEWASEMQDVIFKSLDHLHTLDFIQFHIQFEDDYTYRPSEYTDTIDTVKEKIRLTIPKVHWGMIWCK